MSGECHAKGHKKGYSRIFSNIKLNTRIYKLQKFKHKINSVLDN